MRRAQSLRGRPSVAPTTPNDLGVLREGPDESTEDVLRRQLLDKDRENDRLQLQVQALQAQLSARPALDKVQELEKDYKTLELILTGTQRENEKAMSLLDRAKEREKTLEAELSKLVGDNWQTSLELSSSPSILPSRSHLRINSSLLTASALTPNNPETPMAETSTAHAEHRKQLESQAAHIESVRLLILGMQQRLETRETTLSKTLEQAEKESKGYEEVVKANMASAVRS